MTYDVQIDNTILRSISYAELIDLPLTPTTFLRRNSGNWMTAKNCVELTHVVNSPAQPTYPADFQPHPIYGFREQSVVRNDYPSQAYDNSHDQYYSINSVVVAEPDEDESQYAYNDRDEYDDFEQTLYDNPDYDVPASEPFIPTEKYTRCKNKRRKALIGVISLGLAGLLLIGIGNAWRSNIFGGCSFAQSSGMGFLFKWISFVLISMLIAVPYFIYSFLSLIYYSIRLHNIKH